MNENAVRTLAAFGLRVEADELPERRRRVGEVERETLAASARCWRDHLDHNLQTVLSDASVTDVTGRLAGRTVLVVGSGPSRSALLPDLHAWRDRVVLIATNSAVAPLCRAGCPPDAVVVIEGNDCSRDLAGVEPGLLSRSVLFYKASTHPRHLEWSIPRRVVFLGPSDAWLAGGFGPGAVVPTGGNAGTAALVLGWTLGAQQVLCAGVDFALSAGEETGARGGQDAPTEAVAGWDGELLRAELPFATYREEAGQILTAIRTRDPQARFVNVTPQGARIDGMDSGSWTAIREQLEPCSAPEPVLSFSDASIAARSEEALARECSRIAARLDALAEGNDDPAMTLAHETPPDPLARALVLAELEGRQTDASGRRRACSDAARHLRASASRAIEIIRRRAPA